LCKAVVYTFGVSRTDTAKGQSSILGYQMG
jgi:hypothetical protein